MGKKLESNFINMVVVLFAVTLIASAAVGYVYSLTAEPINLAKQAKQVNAIRQVIPGEFDNNPSMDAWKIATDSKLDYPYLYKEKKPDSLVVYPAKKNGELIGTAVKTLSNNGFGGQVWLMVGFNRDGSIYNYSVLEHKETPGLGSKMDIWFTKEGKGSIIGKIPGTTGLKVTKDGGDVDAITAATISSRAFLDAVNRAAAAISNNTTSVADTTQQNQ